MRRSYITFVFILLGLAASAALAQTTLATPVSLIPFASPDGVELLESAEQKVDFFNLAPHFESQFNRAYCGPTTVAIILNALRSSQLRDGSLQLPHDPFLVDDESEKYFAADYPEKYFGFNRYTQNNVFDISYRKQATDKIFKTRNQVVGEPSGDPAKSDYGLQLAQLNQLFLAHGVKTTLVHVDASSPSNDETGKVFTDNLSQPNNYVVVNFNRPELGQKGGGHISPLGAYDKTSDRFLLMDVNPALADWVWVKSVDLIRAMRTLDKDANANRGYLLISE